MAGNHPHPDPLRRCPALSRRRGDKKWEVTKKGRSGMRGRSTEVRLTAETSGAENWAAGRSMDFRRGRGWVASRRPAPDQSVRNPAETGLLEPSWIGRGWSLARPGAFLELPWVPSGLKNGRKHGRFRCSKREEKNSGTNRTDMHRDRKSEAARLPPLSPCHSVLPALH
jgi:hypothetical protein